MSGCRACASSTSSLPLILAAIVCLHEDHRPQTAQQDAKTRFLPSEAPSSRHLRLYLGSQYLNTFQPAGRKTCNCILLCLSDHLRCAPCDTLTNILTLNYMGLYILNVFLGAWRDGSEGKIACVSCRVGSQCHGMVAHGCM